MKRRLAGSLALWCVTALAISYAATPTQGATSPFREAHSGRIGSRGSQPLRQAVTQPSMSFSTLATFAKRFWTAVANVADSRLKRDENVTSLDAVPPPETARGAPTTVGEPVTPSGPVILPDLTTHITQMLAQITNVTRQLVRSGSRRGTTTTAGTTLPEPEVTSVSDFDEATDDTDDLTTATPTAFHVESTSIFAVTPSPTHRAAATSSSSAPSRLQTHHHTGFGCNDSSHAHVDERAPPPGDDHKLEAVEPDTSTISQLDNKIIDMFLKTNLPKIADLTTTSAAPLSSPPVRPVTRRTPTRAPVTRRRPGSPEKLTASTPTSTSTTPAPTTSTITDTPPASPASSPASILSQLVNMSSSDPTLSMATIIKAITTAMVMVNDNIEGKLTTRSTGNTTRVTATSPPVATTAATTTARAATITATAASTGSPRATLTPGGGAGRPPVPPQRTRIPPGLSVAVPVHVTALRPFPSLNKVALGGSFGEDELQSVKDDHLDDSDPHHEVSNDVDDKDDKFETAEVVKDEDQDEQSLTKRDGGPNSILRSPIKNATEEAGECFFDAADQSTMCGWNFTSLTSVRWSFGLGETAYMNGGPVRDSNGGETGGYAFIDTSTGLIGASTEIQRATLESPSLVKTAPSGRCFTFWYNVGGLSSDRLRVLLVSEEDYSEPTFTNRLPSFTVLWEQKDSTNHTWLKGEILYTFAKQHRLIFEGFARSGNDPRRKFQGFMAVDDIAMDSDSCLSFCTFEGHLCGWENDGNNDNFQWQLGRGSLSHLTGPVRDHGDGPEGGYMVIDSAYPRRPGDMARLTSPDLPPTDNGPVCFKFWTHMYGNGIGTLKVLLKTDSDTKTVWEVSGESGNSWHMAQVTVSSLQPYKIALEGMVGKNSLGSIAIDDLSFGPGPCPSSPQSALPSRGDCTFEADECGWINAGSGDQYDWLRTSAGQPLLPGQGPNSGYRPPEPLADHTTGQSTGFYLTMERSTIPPRSGEQAYIVGPTLQGSEEGKCLSFWAYMHERSVDASGPGLGSLRIYLRIGTSSILRPIWRLINFEYPDWFFAQTHIKTTEKFQIVIGGTWGSTRQGAISVDDFTFYDGNCSVLPAEAQVTAAECTFDSNLCEWQSIVNASKERTSWQLATNIRRPSNLDDHTYRAIAGYVFFDIFSQQPHLVRLESPDIVVDNTSLVEADDAVRCLTFWFAAFGSSRNTFLRVLHRDVASNNETQIWEATTATVQIFRPEWNYGQVAVNNNATHKIIFEGSSNNGGFAVDDVTFIPGFCQSRPDNTA